MFYQVVNLDVDMVVVLVEEVLDKLMVRQTELPVAVVEAVVLVLQQVLVVKEEKD